jgi:hypothetical protein
MSGRPCPEKAFQTESPRLYEVSETYNRLAKPIKNSTRPATTLLAELL